MKSARMGKLPLEIITETVPTGGWFAGGLDEEVELDAVPVREEDVVGGAEDDDELFASGSLSVLGLLPEHPARTAVNRRQARIAWVRMTYTPQAG